MTIGDIDEEPMAFVRVGDRRIHDDGAVTQIESSPKFVLRRALAIQRIVDPMGDDHDTRRVDTVGIDDSLFHVVRRDSDQRRGSSRPWHRHIQIGAAQR